MRNFQLVTKLIIPLVLSACIPITGGQGGPYKTTVIYELCAPKSKSAQDTAVFSTIYANTGFSVVITSGSINETSMTRRGDLIYYSAAESPSELAGMVVKIWPNKSISYVFKFDKNLKLNASTWSKWLEPTFITRDNQLDAVVFKKDRPESIVHEIDTPKIRYKTLQYVEYLRTIKKKTDPLRPSEVFDCNTNS